MLPTLAICNIFDQDAVQLADFAREHGFKGIDWSPDPLQSEEDFIACMEQLAGFQVRIHCRFHGWEFAEVVHRGEEALQLHMRWAERTAMAGIRYMTVHTGLGNCQDMELDFDTGVRNLARLVEYAARLGVTVCLENLTTPLTRDPELFNAFIELSGAAVTFDLGHSQACQELSPERHLASEYLLPNLHKIRNAHVYHIEEDGIGHLPPESLADLQERLSLLSNSAHCDWWVIELFEQEEILRTRRFLSEFLLLPSCRPFRMPLPDHFPLIASAA
jgi:sugar phosphate isomerase/epimerase